MNTKSYQPELLSRKGEQVAWILALVSLVSLLFLKAHFAEIPWGSYAFVILLLLAASSISLGNWMDRHTAITVNPESIAFTNGVRNTEINWDDVKEIRVMETNWGKRVQVLGKDSHFEFRTLGEVLLHGELKGRLGFKEGDEILQTLVSKTGLKETSKKEKSYYYTR